MDIINFSEQNSIINQYLAEIRDKDYQKNRLLFRNNVMRIGEFEAFEISKTLNYEPKRVVTPLGTAQINVPTDKIVLATIFRAGLPFHNGFLNIFDHAGNALSVPIANTRMPPITRSASTWNILQRLTSTARPSSLPTRCWLPAAPWSWATRPFSPKEHLAMSTLPACWLRRRASHTSARHSPKPPRPSGVRLSTKD